MTATEYLDRPPPRCFVLDVMPKSEHATDWVALFVDDHNLLGNTAREYWVRIPGEHTNRDTAWDALQAMMATRH